MLGWLGSVSTGAYASVASGRCQHLRKQVSLRLYFECLNKVHAGGWLHQRWMCSVGVPARILLQFKDNPIDPSTVLHYANLMKVSAQYAEEHFSEVLDAASNGEEVEIAVPGKPALFLAKRIAGRKGTPSGRPRAELFGAGEGLIKLPTDEEWRAMDKEIEDEMLNGPIFPPEHA